MDDSPREHIQSQKCQVNGGKSIKTRNFFLPIKWFKYDPKGTETKRMENCVTQNWSPFIFLACIVQPTRKHTNENDKSHEDNFCLSSKSVNPLSNYQQLKLGRLGLAHRHYGRNSIKIKN